MRNSSSLSPATLEAVFQSLWGLLRAAASSRGGVWAQNLQPALEPVLGRLDTSKAYAQLLHALRVEDGGAAAREALLAAHRRRYLETLQAYVTSPPDSITNTAMAAMSAGAEFLDAFRALDVSPDIAQDLSAFAGGLRALAKERVLTPVESMAIVELRRALNENAEDAAVRDALFELESR